MQMGLLCVRGLWEWCCEEGDNEKCMLYEMNEAFEIDINWSLIRPLLLEMQQSRHSTRISKEIEGMLDLTN